VGEAAAAAAAAEVEESSAESECVCEPKETNGTESQFSMESKLDPLD
jgi:hypothetical protein